MELKTLAPPDLAQRAIDLLEQLQAFSSRAELKASVILGVNTGMIGYLAAKAPAVKEWDLYMLLVLVPVVLITASLVQLYRCSFPQLEGGHESLVYFKEIAKRTESRFLADFRKLSQEALAEDLLTQVWRNSQILTDKYCCLKSAYALCASAVVPWAGAIAICMTR